MDGRNIWKQPSFIFIVIENCAVKNGVVLINGKGICIRADGVLFQINYRKEVQRHDEGNNTNAE